MSGIEIGGIVLGAFPIVVMAIEQYRNGLDILRLWETKNYENELAAIQLEIEVQGTIFRNTYLSLLRTFLDQESIVKLLMEPNGFEKYATLIGPPLKAHLGLQWEMYSKLMGRLQNLLNTLRLHIDRTRPTNTDDVMSKISSVLKPIRFSFGIRQRHGLLHKIKETNGALRTLIEQQNAMKDLAQPLARTAQRSRYWDLRSESSALLSLLSVHFNSCTTDHTHSYGFHLHSLLPLPEEKYSIMRTRNGHRHVEVWIDSHVRPAVGSPVLSDERALYIVSTCSKPDCRAGSLCQLRQPVPSSSRPADSDSDTSRPSRQDFRRYTRHIKSLGGPVCFPASTGTIQQYESRTVPNQGAASASMASMTSAAPVHATFEVRDRGPPAKDISLRTIMSSGTRYQRFPGYFYERDRVNIATLIALSVVCLHKSNWLDSAFSSNKVFFALLSNDISENSVRRPYVKKPHAVHTNPSQAGSASPTNSTTQTPPESPTTFGIRNRALYNLGIMLLELIMNEPLSCFLIPGSSDVSSETEDQVAWRLEQEVCGRAGPVWADVISKCLHCPFRGDPHLDDNVFVSAVCADIVQPLLDMKRLLDGRLSAAPPSNNGYTTLPVRF